MANNPNLIENVKIQFWFVLFSILVFFLWIFKLFTNRLLLLLMMMIKKITINKREWSNNEMQKKNRNFNHFLVVLCVFYSSNSFCHWILSKFCNASCDMLLLMKLMENQFPVHSFIWLCKQCIHRLLFFFWLNFKKKREH